VGKVKRYGQRRSAVWGVCYQELRVLREKRLLNTETWEMRLPGIVAKVICTHSRPPHKNGFALIFSPRAPINLTTNSLKKRGFVPADRCTPKPRPYIKKWRILGQNHACLAKKKGQHPTPNLPATSTATAIPLSTCLPYDT
jgi:hypothetical protein